MARVTGIGGVFFLCRYVPVRNNNHHDCSSNAQHRFEYSHQRGLFVSSTTTLQFSRPAMPICAVLDFRAMKGELAHG